MNRRDWVASTLAGAAAIAVAPAAQAQDADRLLRLIVPYAPGGGVDVQARALAVPLSVSLGRRVIVDNRAGGNTRIATDGVRRAAADGQTLLLVPAVAWIGFVASGTFDYEPWTTLVPVAQIASTPYNFLQTKAGSGLDSWEKVRAHARRTPGGLKVGGPFAGGFIGHAVDEIFRRGGIDGVYAPFTGAAPAHAALLGGTVDLQIITFGDGLGHMSAGLTHGIAVSSAQRHPRAPMVPTFVELGIGDTLNNAFSIWAPPGTTAEQLGQWRLAIRSALQDTAFRALLEDKLAFSVAYKDGDTVTGELVALAREWGPRLRAAR
jgi:tripartite-type tricarboxylate transporter receptor subunit TctC